MVNDKYETVFAGRSVVNWKSGMPLQDPIHTVYRIADEYGNNIWSKNFAEFLQTPGSSAIQALVIGTWGEELGNGFEHMIKKLVSARAQLPHLTALFLGDMTYGDCEISWIITGDISPLLQAYPQLEHLRLRGSGNLTLGQIQHERLKTLIIESGGLDVSVIHDIQRSQLPQLEHLEIWLGDEDYGATTTVEDLAPLFTGQLFPNLRYLGLRDSHIADDIAQAITSSPLLERLRVLDLSMGTLSDVGATALLNCPAIRQLEKLDLHHHYCSPAVVTQLEALGIEVDASDDRREDEERHGFRYVAVAE